MAKRNTAPSVVGGAGLLTSIFTTLDRKVRLYGGTDEDIHRLALPGGEEIIGRMAQVIMDARAQSEPRYPIIINYDESLDEMIKAGLYDHVSDNITTDNFPITGSGMVEQEAVLVHPDRYVSTEGAEQEIGKRGLRPARLEELLAFGAEWPEVQRKFPVVALGSSWVHSDSQGNVASLVGGSSGRAIVLDWCGIGWHEFCRFLAVPK